MVSGVTDVAKAFRPLKARAHRFSLFQLTVALLRAADIHEGFWQLQVVFGQTATNISINGKMTPTAFAQVMGVQLGRVEKPGDLTVDAAEVNPEKRIIVPPVVN